MQRFLALCCLVGLSVHAGAAGAAAAPQPPKVAPAPPRQEGDGPYSQLVLRNATVINGTGAPAFGPADIVIEGNRIVQVLPVGAPVPLITVALRRMSCEYGPSPSCRGGAGATFGGAGSAAAPASPA